MTTPPLWKACVTLAKEEAADVAGVDADLVEVNRQSDLEIAAWQRGEAGGQAEPGRAGREGRQRRTQPSIHTLLGRQTSTIERTTHRTSGQSGDCTKVQGRAKRA